MKLITRDIDYAVRALCYMARKREDVISVTELVKNLNIPRQFLRKILQILKRNRMLRSYKGIGGGFTLALPAEKIELVELIKIFQGPFTLNECFFKKVACPSVQMCRLKKKIDAVEKYVMSELKSITITSLLK